jgi:hypothetical protein
MLRIWYLASVPPSRLPSSIETVIIPEPWGAVMCHTRPLNNITRRPAYRLCDPRYKILVQRLAELLREALGPPPMGILMLVFSVLETDCD